MRSRARSLIACAVLTGLLAGCAGLRDALDPQPPSASVTGARLATLGFDHAELVLDVRIDNPNAVAIDLAGFDYRLRADGKTLLEGRQKRRLEIAARDRTDLEVPLRIGFGDVAGILGGLSERDAIGYDIRLGIDAEIPVLGTRRVEVETDGTLPVPHRPRLSLQAMRLERLDLDGAVIGVTLDIFNPNGFSLALDRLDYRLEVDGRRWARGGSSAPLRIGPNERGTLNLSLRIDFDDLGSGAYSLLATGNPLDYRLQASLAATAGDDRLGSFELPWSTSGRFEPR